MEKDKTKRLFQQLIKDFVNQDIKNVITRDYNIPVLSNKIVSLIGVRRSGKTFILYDLIKQLRLTNDKTLVIYINFEDDRLLGLQAINMQYLIDAYYELYPENRQKKVYLFFDEIQTVTGWELFVRRIYDTLSIQLFLTGSSSKLLSSEIATSLRGRTITYEIFPFSFKEYLKFQHIDIDLISSSSRSFIIHALNNYLRFGGFAETISQTTDIQKKILSDYYQLVIYKDVAERYHIENLTLLKHLIKYVFTNPATLVSLNKLYNEFKSQGFSLSKDSLFNFFGYLNDAYLTFYVPILRNNIKEEQRNPKKIYIVDNGFKFLQQIGVELDESKLYENCVFLSLRRQTDQIFYFKQKQEVDFYCVINQKQLLINVSVDISDSKTRSREINGLLEAMTCLKIKESYLITNSEQDTVCINGLTIYIIPLVVWLLRNEV